MARSRALRRAVERLAAKPRGRRFVGEMRRDLVAYVHERRAAGASLSSIEREIGVSEPTLRRLVQEGMLVPVEVKDAAVDVPTPRVLLLRGPCGVVVEGSVDDIAALLLRLQP